MTAIDLRGVQKHFAGQIAVHALDLGIVSGEFLTLLGPSGCGKTTTLRMIAGLEPVTAGEIHFDGRRIDTLSPGARNVAMVFQNYALYPHLSVRGNLEYPLRKRNVVKPERQRLVTQTAAMLRIEELLERKPRQLSGGQQQRVALGRAMIRDPAAFLFDEPLSNLDAQLRSVMRAELVGLHARLGKTMVYVTHDQLEAMTMSTRIAVMFQGRLQQIGTPAEIYDSPANRFVAGFVGTPAMRFIDGEVRLSSTGPCFHAADLPPIICPRHAAPGPIVAGIRSEHVSIGPTGAMGMAEVTVVEALGHETLVTLRAGRTQLGARAPAGIHVRPGELVSYRLQQERIHYFRADDGRRVATADDRRHIAR